MKQIVIDDQLHGQVKAAAALRGETLREFAERALRAALPTWTNSTDEGSEPTNIEGR